ncbi:unnamed protein product [Musa hybrid cultivar]
MLQNMIEQNPEGLLIEGISSPIAAQLLDFCEDDDGRAAGDLFPGSDYQQHQPILFAPYDDVSSSTAAATTAASTPLCCYPGDDASFSPFPSFYALLDASPPRPDPDPEPDLAHYPSSSSSSSNPPPPPAILSVPPPPYSGDPLDQLVTTDAISSEYPFDHGLVVRVPAAGPSASQQQHPQAAYEDERYSAAGGMQQSSELVRLEAPPCGFIEGVGIGALYCGGMLYGGERPQGLSGGGMPVLGPVNVSDSSGLGPYVQDAMPHMYSSGDLQVLGGGSQHLMGGCSGNQPPAPLPTSDVAPLDDSAYKVGRLSVEERKEKIHRYMRKRNERNFSKKIKYACRKTLADSRPRVRGRFAKNDELGEVARLSSSSHEFDDDEEVSSQPAYLDIIPMESYFRSQRLCSCRRSSRRKTSSTPLTSLHISAG